MVSYEIIGDYNHDNGVEMGMWFLSGGIRGSNIGQVKSVIIGEMCVTHKAAGGAGLIEW